MLCSSAEEVSCDSSDKRVSSSLRDLSSVARSGAGNPAPLMTGGRLFAGGGGGYGRRELRKSGIECVASRASAMANDEGGVISSDGAGGTGDAPGAGEDDEDGSAGLAGDLASARSEPSGCGEDGVSRAVMSVPLEGAPGKGECLKRGMAAWRGVE
jgi:hypothetical protein